jgi:hypothetical protein
VAPRVHKQRKGRQDRRASLSLIFAACVFFAFIVSWHEHLLTARRQDARVPVVVVIQREQPISWRE